MTRTTNNACQQLTRAARAAGIAATANFAPPSALREAAGKTATYRQQQ